MKEATGEATVLLDYTGSRSQHTSTRWEDMFDREVSVGDYVVASTRDAVIPPMTVGRIIATGRETVQTVYKQNGKELLAPFVRPMVAIMFTDDRLVDENTDQATGSWKPTPRIFEASLDYADCAAFGFGMLKLPDGFLPTHTVSSLAVILPEGLKKMSRPDLQRPDCVWEAILRA